MPTHTQKTAMQMLFDRNQEIIDKLEFTSNPMQVEYRKALVSVNDDIDTELLEIEKQHREKIKKQYIIDAYNQGYRDGELDAVNPKTNNKDIAEFNDAINYFNQTFNPNKK